MMAVFYRLYSFITGKNAASTPVSLIQEQLSERRPLPVGLTEFHEWTDRIISGSGLTVTPETQKYALARMILDLKPTIAFESDIFFIHALRKAASNQIADGYMKDAYAAKQAKLAAEEEAKKQNQGEATPPTGQDGKVLEIKRV